MYSEIHYSRETGALVIATAVPDVPRGTIGLVIGKDYDFVDCRFAVYFPAFPNKWHVSGCLFLLPETHFQVICDAA